MASMNYSVDSHPVRFPVVEAALGAGGKVVYEDKKHGESWGFVEELEAPAVTKGTAVVMQTLEATEGAAPVATEALEVEAPVSNATETVDAPVADAKLGL